MLLRRITKHVRDQNWFAVGLDFAIVVVGVFIGIQVANWNEALADRRLGDDYRERLISDLRKDLGNLQRMESYYDEVLASVRAAEHLLIQPQPDPRQLLKASYRASEINYEPQTRATWDQILSSGHIGLLPREATAQLAEYFAFDFAREANDLLATSGYRERVRSLIPLPVQEAIREGCSDVRAETAVLMGFVERCVIDAEDSAIVLAAERIKADSGLLAALNWHYSHAWSAVVNARGLSVLVQRGLDALEGADASLNSAHAQ